MAATRAAAVPWGRVLAVAVVLVPVVWWAADRHGRIANQDRLAAIASQIAGRPVRVHCPGPIGRMLVDTVDGSVQFDASGHPADETRLQAQPCDELEALAKGRRGAELACAARSDTCGDAALRVAQAVDVITHESFHLRGVMDEGVTECDSLQTMAWTATQFGASPAEGEGLARLQLTAQYPLLPDRYRDSRCRDGGPLDLRPADPAWP